MVVSSLTDAASLCGIARHLVGDAAVVVYQHESQLIYPRATRQSKQPDDEAGSMAEWRSMIAADEVWFNSAFSPRRVLLSSQEALCRGANDARCRAPCRRRLS